MRHILKAIGNLGIDILVSASTQQNFIFPLQKFFEKIKHMINTILVLNYLTPVSLCYSYLFLYDLSFHTSRGIFWFFEKRLIELDFWSTHLLAFQKKRIVLMKILGNIIVKHPFWGLLFKYICRPSRCVKDHSP